MAVDANLLRDVQVAPDVGEPNVPGMTNLREALSKEHSMIASGLEEGWIRSSLISRRASSSWEYILSIYIALARPSYT